MSSAISSEDWGSADVPEAESERLRRGANQTFALAEAASDEHSRQALYRHAVYLAQAAAEEAAKENRDEV